MSRCFPFPPPGYEKKSRAEDVDILKKQEKNKEKKHKKEKKEKEKREGKEKREKDKSDDKRRDKKDKKDRDKKKDKEKDKDKAHPSVEGRSLGKIESQNGDGVVEVKDNNVQVEKCAVTGQIDSYNGIKISQNQNILSKETKNSKVVQEVGRRIEDSGSGRVDKFSVAVAQPRRDVGMVTLVAKDSDTFTEGKEQNKNKKIDDRKYNGQGIRHEERFIGNTVVPSSSASVEAGMAGMHKLHEKTADKGIETNDKIRQKEGDEKRGSKHKDKDKDKDKEKKGGSYDKEKKKEKKAKEKVEEKVAIVDKSKEIHKDNLVGRHSTNTNTSQLPDSNKGAAVVESLIKKRKELEPNGVLHAIDNRSSKLLRPTSHPLKENGRILEPGLTSIFPASERHEVAKDHTLGSKESKKINGIIEAHSTASAKHSARQDDQLSAIPKKSSHPDSKYLSQVYSVPKMEELSDCDNQEWLFCSNTSQLMKPKLEASQDEEMPLVWAESMLIESADVCALPYVIPY